MRPGEVEIRISATSAVLAVLLSPLIAVSVFAGLSSLGFAALADGKRHPAAMRMLVVAALSLVVGIVLGLVWNRFVKQG